MKEILWFICMLIISAIAFHYFFNDNIIMAAIATMFLLISLVLFIKEEEDKE